MIKKSKDRVAVRNKAFSNHYEMDENDNLFSDELFSKERKNCSIRVLEM